MPPKKTPAPSARKTTVKASIPPLIPKSAAPGHGMSTRPSNKLTHPGLDAMDALRARAQQRPKSVIEAERAVKAAASQARAEAAVTREIAAQELAEYENQITAKAKVSEKEADHPPARRTLPLRATRAVASTRTISSQLVSTPGKNDSMVTFSWPPQPFKYLHNVQTRRTTQRSLNHRTHQRSMCCQTALKARNLRAKTS